MQNNRWNCKGEINAPIIIFKDLFKFFDVKEHSDCRHETGYTLNFTLTICLSLRVTLVIHTLKLHTVKMELIHSHPLDEQCWCYAQFCLLTRTACTRTSLTVAWALCRTLPCVVEVRVRGHNFDRHAELGITPVISTVVNSNVSTRPADGAHSLTLADVESLQRPTADLYVYTSNSVS